MKGAERDHNDLGILCRTGPHRGATNLKVGQTSHETVLNHPKTVTTGQILPTLPTWLILKGTFAELMNMMTYMQSAVAILAAYSGVRKTASLVPPEPVLSFDYVFSSFGGPT